MDDDRSPVISITAWFDPVIDDSGYDPRSTYVETFWLGVLGPTATWLIRRLAAGLDRHPDGYRIDLRHLAREMGLSYSAQRASPFAKALNRCVMFGVAHPTADGLAVRRRIPPVAVRHLRRMTRHLQVAHDDWDETHIAADALTRAHRLAIAMVDVGDDVAIIESQLVALGVPRATASAAADNAAQLAAAS
jgi:hypothetical protein